MSSTTLFAWGRGAVQRNQSVNESVLLGVLYGTRQNFGKRHTGDRQHDCFCTDVLCDGHEPSEHKDFHKGVPAPSAGLDLASSCAKSPHCFPLGLLGTVPL